MLWEHDAREAASLAATAHSTSESDATVLGSDCGIKSQPSSDSVSEASVLWRSWSESMVSSHALVTRLSCLSREISLCAWAGTASKDCAEHLCGARRLHAQTCNRFPISDVTLWRSKRATKSFIF